MDAAKRPDTPSTECAGCKRRDEIARKQREVLEGLARRLRGPVRLAIQHAIEDFDKAAH